MSDCVDASLLAMLPQELCFSLLSNYLADPFRSRQSALHAFPCVCRQWASIIARHARLWPALRERDFDAQKPLTLMNLDVYKNNPAQAAYMQLHIEYCAWQSRHLFKGIRAIKELPASAGLAIRSLPPRDSHFRNWEAKVIGPTNTPYSGGIFLFHISLHEKYPFKPPTVQAKTKIFHVNVCRDGYLLELGSHRYWSPQLNLQDVLQSIQVILRMPRFEDPANADVYNLYLTDRVKYEATCTEWVQLHASNEPYGTLGYDDF